MDERRVKGFVTIFRQNFIVPKKPSQGNYDSLFDKFHKYPQIFFEYQKASLGYENSTYFKVVSEDITDILENSPKLYLRIIAKDIANLLDISLLDAKAIKEDSLKTFKSFIVVGYPTDVKIFKALIKYYNQAPKFYFDWVRANLYPDRDLKFWVNHRKSIQKAITKQFEDWVSHSRDLGLESLPNKRRRIKEYLKNLKPNQYE